MKDNRCYLNPESYDDRWYLNPAFYIVLICIGLLSWMVAINGDNKHPDASLRTEQIHGCVYVTNSYGPVAAICHAANCPNHDSTGVRP
jgi:hypothetical protein